MARKRQKSRGKKKTLRQRVMDLKKEWIDPSGASSAEQEEDEVETFDKPTAKKVGFAWTIDNRGERKPVYLEVQRHTLVAGTTGGGKSVTTNAIITQLAQIGPPCPGDKNEDGSEYRGAYCALLGADLKGGIELAPWFPRLSFVATRLNEVDFMLDMLLEENDRRAAFLRQSGAKKIKPNRKYPLIICIIDELAEVTASKENGKAYEKAKKDKGDGEFDEYRLPHSDADRQAKLRRISALGRSQGIFLIVATQKPSSKLIDTDFRDNFDQRLCHRVNSTTNVTMILGQGFEKVAPAQEIPQDLQGMMFAKVSSYKNPVKCRSEYYQDDEIDQIAAATEHCRYDLKFMRMPGYLYHGSVMEELAQKRYSIAEKERQYKEQQERAASNGEYFDECEESVLDGIQYDDEPEVLFEELDGDYPDEDSDFISSNDAGGFAGEDDTSAFDDFDYGADDLDGIAETPGDPARAEEPGILTMEELLSGGDAYVVEAEDGEADDSDELDSFVSGMVEKLVGNFESGGVGAETTEAILVSSRKSRQPAASDPSRRMVRKQRPTVTRTASGMVLHVAKTTEETEEQRDRERKRRDRKSRKPVLHEIPERKPKRSRGRAEEPELPATAAVASESLMTSDEPLDIQAPLHEDDGALVDAKEDPGELLEGIDTALLMDALMGVGLGDDDNGEEESMDPDDWEWNEVPEDSPF